MGRHDGYDDNGTALELYRPERVVQRGSRGLSELDIECENLEFGFKDILKLTKKTRRLQDRIDKELECENTGGLVKAGHSVWKEVKRVTGAKVKTLGEFYEEQHQLVKQVCGGLYGLHHLCQKHYLELVSFRKLSNERISHMRSKQPGLNRRPQEMMREYQKMLNRLSTLRRNDPQYTVVRDDVCMLRDMLNQAEHSVDVINKNLGTIDSIAIGVDSGAQLLLHGKNILDLLLQKYGITDDFLKEALPALNFVRDVWKNIGALYELNKTISRSIRQAGNIEVKLEDPRLLSRVTRDIPALAGKSTVDALDYLNSDIRSRRR